MEKIFNSQDLLRKEYGKQATTIKIRMLVLLNAPCLIDVPTQKPERRHQLKGKKKDCFAVDLKHPFRLVFEPAESPIPKTADGGIDLALVKCIRILAVEDYH